MTNDAAIFNTTQVIFVDSSMTIQVPGLTGGFGFAVVTGALVVVVGMLVVETVVGYVEVDVGTSVVDIKGIKEVVSDVSVVEVVDVVSSSQSIRALLAVQQAIQTAHIKLMVKKILLTAIL